MFFLNAVDEILIFNVLQHGGYFMYHHDQHSGSLHGPDNALHVVFMDLTTNSNFCYILH